jgi:5-methylcytosine-specific restriction enzyme A
MPQAAPRFCPRCKAPHPSGSECPIGAAERKADVDRHRPGSRQRGYNIEWQKRRAAFLRAHPNCVVCGAPAVEVDHIKPVSLGGAFWDESNWAARCKSCHSAKTMGELNARRVPRRAPA